MMFYEYNLVAFVAVNAYLGYAQYQREVNASKREVVTTEEGAAISAAQAVNWQFKKRFLPVYLLVAGSDWLQGPYIYTMYKDQKGLAEETVAYLFTTGFLAAAASASFVGSLADKHGRRKACLFFCIIYAISCFSILFDDIVILFAGRILGGVATTLMYSVFESWMVTEYHKQHLDDAGGSLSEIFGLMTTLNGITAILAGLFAQAITDFMRTQTAPFMAAVVALFSAFGYISRHWPENHGDSANKGGLDEKTPEEEQNGFTKDKRLWALCLTSTAFEGSMYLWIFFKFPALKLSREESGDPNDLPFGMIFAVLMCGMMLGSFIFTYLSSLKDGQWVLSFSTLLTGTLMLASFCFIVPVLVHNEATTFWCFCIFEICCGIYFPSIANLKEKIIDDGVRAKIYGIMRVPLNAFVVMGLVLTQDGLRHRENVFMCCAGALISASAALGYFVTE